MGIELTERQVQTAIVGWLEYIGKCTVFETQYRYRKTRCVRCGTLNAPEARGYGVTKGLADLVVMKLGWPRGLALLLEVKRDKKAALTDEQKVLRELGMIQIVTCIEDAECVLREFEEMIKGINYTDVWER